MTARESVKLVNAALDEDEQHNIVLRGVLSNESLYKLNVGPYQREVLPISRIHDLEAAFNDNSSVPDVDLGMRGGSFIEKEGVFYLQDPVFIVDGLQRTTAARKCAESGHIPRVGAIVHFNTTEQWERERFRILNTMHTKLSPNVLIRNMIGNHNSLEMLNSLCKDKSFVLSGKVCWNQRMARGELITALTLLKTVFRLHSNFTTGLRSSRYAESLPALEKIYTKIGRGTLRENVRTFWAVMDECFNIRYVTYKEGSTFLKGGFLYSVAGVFSDHENFWDDAKLKVSKDLVKKLAKFPINDPQICKLATTSGATSRSILYEYLVKHINSGKKTKHLVASRKALQKPKVEDEAEIEESIGEIA